LLRLRLRDRSGAQLDSALELLEECTIDVSFARDSDAVAQTAKRCECVTRTTFAVARGTPGDPILGSSGSRVDRRLTETARETPL